VSGAPEVMTSGAPLTCAMAHPTWRRRGAAHRCGHPPARGLRASRWISRSSVRGA